MGARPVGGCANTRSQAGDVRLSHAAVHHACCPPPPCMTTARHGPAASVHTQCMHSACTVLLSGASQAPSLPAPLTAARPPRPLRSQGAQSGSHLRCAPADTKQPVRSSPVNQAQRAKEQAPAQRPQQAAVGHNKQSGPGVGRQLTHRQQEAHAQLYLPSGRRQTCSTLPPASD